MDPYKVLGIVRSSTAEEIKAAYKREVFRLHPDRNPGRDTMSQFRAAVDAYERLTKLKVFDFFDWPQSPPPNPYIWRSQSSPSRPFRKREEYGPGPSPEVAQKSTSKLFKNLMNDIKAKKEPK